MLCATQAVAVAGALFADDRAARRDNARPRSRDQKIHWACHRFATVRENYTFRRVRNCEVRYRRDKLSRDQS